jgi:hypothetical protein
MINSKIEWNGKPSSFDELKGLIEGHFEGNGASYLVHHCFLDRLQNPDSYGPTLTLKTLAMRPFLVILQKQKQN